LRSPVFLSFQFSDVAMRRLAMRPAVLEALHFRILPRLPIRMTLLTLPP
jgi:hypothetical protein